MSESPVQLMDPKIDFAFKQVFAGNSKESKVVLIALLSAILDRDEDERITDIVYLNPYTDKSFEDAKQSIMDIKVKTTITTVSLISANAGGASNWSEILKFTTLN